MARTGGPTLDPLTNSVVQFGAQAIATSNTESSDEVQGSSNDGPNACQVAGGIMNMIGKAMPIVGMLCGGRI